MKQNQKYINEIIIRKDIFYIARLTFYLIAICFMFLIPIIQEGLNHTRYESKFIGVCLFGIFFFPIYLIYCLYTYKNKYLKINHNSVEDRTRFDSPKFYQLSSIKNIDFNKREVVLELDENNFIIIPELRLKKCHKDKILEIFKNRDKNSS